MQYRRFGKTDLQMPVFSCGGMRYQHGWTDVDPSEIDQKNQDNLEATIRRSVELGINHIETARGYGTSEMQLAPVLSEFPREDLIVQTKIAPYESVEKFLKTFETSMNYLKLDHIELLGIHGINNEELLDWTLKKGGCLEAARKLQDQGIVKNIGFSTHGDLNTIVKAIESDEFTYVNLHWYYILQQNWPAVEAATQRDMGVFIISPSDKGGLLYKPSNKLVELCAPLSPMVFNDLFCLSRPEIHTLSLGAACPGDFDEHMKVLDLLENPEETLGPIIERLDAELENTAGADYLKNYKQGLPDWRDTPGEINIPVILWLRTIVNAFAMHEYGKMRYNLLGNGDHWFPGEQAGKVSEHDLSTCLSGHPYAEQIPQMLSDTHRMLKSDEVKRLSESE